MNVESFNISFVMRRIKLNVQYATSIAEHGTQKVTDGNGTYRQLLQKMERCSNQLSLLVASDVNF